MAAVSKDPTWTQEFKQEIKGIRSDIHYKESSNILRRLIKSKLLLFTDMRDRPERFFEAHRLLLAPGERGAGFGIRFTVQFNLFAGSILGLGTPEQVDSLSEMQEKGSLGCFCLTEKMAGVNSGLVVNTTITWKPETQNFVLHSPNEGSYKNWISQGLTADKAVVVAKLIVNGKNHGPHAFVINMRDETTGELLPGITVGDMGLKTTANDLDNAWVKFDNVSVSHESMLRRFCKIENNQYIQTTAEKMRLEVIGQRLLTGRLAIAEASIVFAKEVYDLTRAYGDKKKCWSPVPGEEPSLSSLPHLKALFARAYKELNMLENYCLAVEDKLSAVLRSQGIPDAELVESIAAAKIKAVTTAMDFVYLLKKEVGSFALMGNVAGFENTDFFLCCAFAEGDTRILQQKIARDRVKAFKQQGWAEIGKSMVMGTATDRAEVAQLIKLTQALEKEKSNPGKAWDDNYEGVYNLAQLVCARHIERTIGSAPAISNL